MANLIYTNVVNPSPAGISHRDQATNGGQDVVTIGIGGDDRCPAIEIQHTLDGLQAWVTAMQGHLDAVRSDRELATACAHCGQSVAVDSQGWHHVGSESIWCNEGDPHTELACPPELAVADA